MRFLVSLYVLSTLIIAGFMIFRDGFVWGGIALLVGSLLGIAGGGGMRGAFYLAQRKSGIVIGLLLLLAGTTVLYSAEVTLDLFGLRMNGDVWPAAGFALAFLAARPSDVAPEPSVEDRERT